jgi:dTDP-4-dehydrorhamnose 3,5-epimerase
VRAIPTSLREVLLIELDVHRDPRGVFCEMYEAGKYQALGIGSPFVQDNCSRSVGGTLRGLHLQVERPQAKLIHVVEGEIYDVAVDVRLGSPTFGRWVANTLSGERFTQCFIPPGFAHGFAVTSGFAVVTYKCSDTYHPAGEIGIAWNDPALAIPWPITAPLLSDRDRRHPTLEQVSPRLPMFGRTDL